MPSISHKRFYIAGAAAALLVSAAFAIAPTVFVPDATFKASNLTGWHALGAADWTAQNGELIGKPKQASGGWLILDKSYQDVGFFASFRCSEGCKTGVLLRAEKTPAGMKGIYMSLTEGDVAAYRVTLDAQGKELTREKLRPGGGQIRIAPPAPTAAEAAGRGGRGGAGRGGRGATADTANLPLKAALGRLSSQGTGIRSN